MLTVSRVQLNLQVGSRNLKLQSYKTTQKIQGAFMFAGAFMVSKNLASDVRWAMSTDVVRNSQCYRFNNLNSLYVD